MIRLTVPKAKATALGEIELLGRRGPPATNYAFSETPAHAIDILAGEVRTTMALCGAATLADLDRSLVQAARPARLPESPD